MNRCNNNSYPGSGASVPVGVNQQNSSMITENSKVPFGKTERGKKLKECSTTFLQWMVDHLWDTDHHEFAFAAKKVLNNRRTMLRDDREYTNLEKAADEFLKAHGLDKFGRPK